MVLTWILSACLVPIIILTPIPTGGSVSMCVNETYIASDYQLSRVETDPTNCTCLLTSTTQTTTTKVIFKTSSFNGCRYKLAFYFNGTMPFQSCDSFESVFTSATVKVNLEPYRQNRSITTFTVNITSRPETDLTMTCFVHEVTPSTTTSTTSTATSTSEETSVQESTDASSSTIPSTSTISTAGTTPKYTSTSTDGSTPNVTDDDTSELTESTTYNNTMTSLPITDSEEHEYIGEIVGGVLGCLALIACIILIVCLIKGKRNRADRKGTVNGNLKMSRRTSNISRTKVNNNDSPNQEMLIIPNEVYVSIDSVQQPTFNKRPEMEIIENDLYVSSDTIDKEYDNAEPKMEIIENDLYVSSDTVDKSYDNAEPKMEIIENDLYVSSDSVLTENDNPTPEIIENDLYVSSDNGNFKSETENANNDVDVPIEDPNNVHIYETIENDKCSCSDTPSSGDRKFKQSMKSPHYFVVCPKCDIKEYEA